MKSIKLRLTRYILIIFIIPISAFLFYSLFFVSREVSETKLEAIETKLNWASQYVNSVTNQLEDLVYAIQIEDDLLEKIDLMYSDSNDVESLVRDSLFVNNNLVSSIQVFSINTLNQISLSYEEGFSKRIITYDNPEVQELNQPSGLKFTSNGGSIKVLHSINNFATQELEGGIVLTLNNNLTTELESIFNDELDYFLLTSDEFFYGDSQVEDLVASEIVQSLKDQNQGVYQTSFEEQTMFVKRVGLEDLYLLVMIPNSELNAFNNNLINVALLIVFVSLLVTIPTSMLFSSKITVPIIRLVNHMKEFSFSSVKSGDLPYDEIKLLEHSYNQMIEQVNQLIKDKYQNELDRKNAQLKALQAQINPHFLANTFQLIGGMAMSIKAQDIYDATIKMSHLVRYSMNINQEASTLGEELIHIKDFLDIQKLRFGHRLVFNISVKDKFKNIKIPKFTLQPIIENAFQHGLQSKKGAWQIDIIAIETEHFELLIKDNGKGISNTDIEVINSKFLIKDNYLIKGNEQSLSGIALENIDSRIKLLYGPDYGLQIASNKDSEGVTISIKIPKEEVSL